MLTNKTSSNVLEALSNEYEIHLSSKQLFTVILSCDDLWIDANGTIHLQQGWANFSVCGPHTEKLCFQGASAKCRAPVSNQWLIIKE